MDYIYFCLFLDQHMSYTWHQHSNNIAIYSKRNTQYCRYTIMHVHNISYTIRNLNWYQLQYKYRNTSCASIMLTWDNINIMVWILAKLRNMLEVWLCQLGYTLHSWCITFNDHMQFMCACSLGPVCYSGVVGMPSLQLSILLNHCHHPSVVRVTLYKMMNSWWKHWRWSINNYHLLDVTLPLYMFTATHLPP